MNYFVDTEFTKLPWEGSPELISIGIVDEKGGEYYACLNNFNPQQTSEFVQNNVIPKLPDTSKRKPVSTVKDEVHEFLNQHQDVEKFWCMYPTNDELSNWGFCEEESRRIMDEYGDIDVQLLQDLLGDFYLDSWPTSGSNLVPLVDQLQQEQNVPENNNLHNALADARWNRAVWKKAQNQGII